MCFAFILFFYLTCEFYSAVSEYKWVRLQDGGPLSLIETYDACTRGVGGDSFPDIVAKLVLIFVKQVRSVFYFRFDPITS